MFHLHTHKHTHLNAYTYIPTQTKRFGMAEASRGEATGGVLAVIRALFEVYSCQAPNTSDLISRLQTPTNHARCVCFCAFVSPEALQTMKKDSEFQEAVRLN